MLIVESTQTTKKKKKGKRNYWVFHDLEMTFFKILVSFLCASTLFFISCFVTSFFHLILYNECLDHYTDFSNVTFNVYMSYIIWMCFRNNWLSGFCLNFTFFPHYSCPSHHQPEKLQISSNTE